MSLRILPQLLMLTLAKVRHHHCGRRPQPQPLRSLSLVPPPRLHHGRRSQRSSCPSKPTIQIQKALLPPSTTLNSEMTRLIPSAQRSPNTTVFRLDPNNGRIIPVPRTGKGLCVVIEGETSRSHTRWAAIFAMSSSLITAHCSLTSRVAAGAVVTLMAFSGRLTTISTRMRLLLGKVTKPAIIKKPNSTPSGKLPLQLPPYLANEVQCVPP
jgi:hypothetical protein